MSDLPPQLAEVAVLDEQGLIWLPDPNHDGEDEGWPVRDGLRLAWLPLDQPDRVMIQLLGGRRRDEDARPPFAEEGFVAGMERDDLRQLIRQLQAIDAMLEER